MSIVSTLDDLTLTLVDTTQIQGYIFGSNRLRENVLASAMVEQATRLWPFEVVESLTTRHNLQKNQAMTGYLLREDRRIEDGALEVEAIYGAGGNTALLFVSRSLALAFAREFSRRLLLEAPGLETAILHRAVRWNEGSESLRRALPDALAQFDVKKGNRPLSTPLLGLGVTARCEVTGLPAVGNDHFYAKMERTARPVSSSLWVRGEQANVERARNRFHEFMPMLRDENCDFWYDPEEHEMGSTEPSEGSYIAVVHADGNGVGARFAAVTRRAADDRAAIRGLRALSQLVDESGAAALNQVGACLVSPEVWDREENVLAGRVLLKQEKRGRQLVTIMPFRPLIFGGDDLTFICEGHLGIPLAVAYLTAFEQEINHRQAQAEELRALLPAALHRWHACAGVAVVKEHYPFARAYELSASLCKSAKQWVFKESNENGEGGFSALDWHITPGGLYGEIEQIRAREYVVAAGKLASRPLRLREHHTTWRSWPTFVRVVNEFREGRAWKGKQNKVIQLREALRSGPNAVERYLQNYRLSQLPLLDEGIQNLKLTGWDAKQCGYFDAIEALDFVVNLPNLETKDSAKAKHTKLDEREGAR